MNEPTSLKLRRPKGFGLLEIVIASAIVSITLFSLSFVFVLSGRLEAQSIGKVRANFLAEEGLEAMRFLRDKGWGANLAPLAAGTNYYLSFATSTADWSVGTAYPGFIDGLFHRRITVEAVNRDGSDDIVTSGGALDPNTKKINIEVSWYGQGATTTATLSTYLSDVFNN